MAAAQPRQAANPTAAAVTVRGSSNTTDPVVHPAGSPENRTCTRDVGPDLQEIYIKQGARTIWSSDKCGLYKGSDPQPFTPNFVML